MKMFGAKLEADEEKDLLAYLASASNQIAVPFITTYEEQKARFGGVRKDKIDFTSAKKIFEQNCALCHGEKGEGSRGPRLRARNIPKEEFVSSVSLGKNTMPAFESSLSRDQIVELWNWLQRPIGD
jgi:mono/diheme cytochrome c family protein